MLKTTPIRRAAAESAEDVDPEHYLDTAFESPVPGYTIKPGAAIPSLGPIGQQPFYVYTPGGNCIGHLLYDPQDDLPQEARDCKNAHWIAAVGWQDNEQNYCDNFKDAALFVIHFPNPSNPAKEIAETLLEADLPAPDPSVEPDFDPEHYLKTTEVGLGDLKRKLSRMYDTVKIHVREPTYLFWVNERHWTVCCARSQPMPYPANLQHGSQGAHFKMLVEQYFNDWARNNRLFLTHFKTHGYLRRRVTFTFDTRNVYDALNRRSSPEQAGPPLAQD